MHTTSKWGGGHLFESICDSHFRPLSDGSRHLRRPEKPVSGATGGFYDMENLKKHAMRIMGDISKDVVFVVSEF